MTTFADFPSRPSARGTQTLFAAFDRRFEGRPFRRMIPSAAAHLGVAHPGRFELERPSLFETAFPERR